MNNEAEVQEFLRSRRDRLHPPEVGIFAGGRRRVPGLRREEVAALAGLSTDYYSRMERGNLAGVSADALNALARALRLDDAETAHLHDLAHQASCGPTRRRTRSPGTCGPRPSLQRVLDAIVSAPAWIVNERSDVLAVNTLGRALLAPLFEDPTSGNNLARFAFLSPAARSFFPDWERGADGTVAALRVAAGRNPHDKELTSLIGELVTRSDAFRTRWSAHNVCAHHTGTKRIHHPEVGDLEFVYEGMELPTNPGWVLFVYTTKPGSASEERIRLLGSVAASSLPSPSSSHRG